MLLPTVSVTVIGLIAGLIFVVVRSSQPLPTLLLGVAGAWVGFIVGAIFGVVVDVIAQTGVYLGIVGHLMTIPGVVVALLRFQAVKENVGHL